MEEKFKIIQSFGHKCLYRYNLNEASNQNNLLTTNLNKDMEEVKIMQLFGQECSICQSKLQPK